MGNLTTIGRIFFGIAIAALGVQTIYYHEFPYMMIPPKHSWIPGVVLVAYAYGVLLTAAGVCIALDKKARPVALLLGGMLLLVFLFYFIPYQLLMSTNSHLLVDWENAAKELSLASGAFVVASCAPGKNENAFTYLTKLIPLGAIAFSFTMIYYGVVHFLYAKEVATYIPPWVPYPVFWSYVAGIGLLSAGLGIILKIKARLAATLLGAMIFTWFIVLHIPKVIVARPPYLWGEVTSALIALAYCGVAFVVAGGGRK